MKLLTIIATACLITARTVSAEPAEFKALLAGSHIDKEMTSIRTASLYFKVREYNLRGLMKARESYQRINSNIGDFRHYEFPQCISGYSDQWTDAAFDYVTTLQEWVFGHPWRAKQFRVYFAKYYHAGGPGKTKKARDARNASYARSMRLIYPKQNKRIKAVASSPLKADQKDRWILETYLVYRQHPGFLSMLQKLEGGGRGNELGHESPVNNQVWANPCLSEGSEQYGRATLAIYRALENYVMQKNSWERKQFLKFYGARLGLSKECALEFANMMIKFRKEYRGIYNLRLKMGGYSPIRFPNEPEPAVR